MKFKIIADEFAGEAIEATIECCSVYANTDIVCDGCGVWQFTGEGDIPMFVVDVLKDLTENYDKKGFGFRALFLGTADGRQCQYLFQNNEGVRRFPELHI